MPRMLVASSPVEIEAKVEEAGLPHAAHDVARRMFHLLTDRLAKATIAWNVQHEEWPNHRFYFGTRGQEMSALLDGLQARPDIVEAAVAIIAKPQGIAGLYAQDQEQDFIGILVGHQNHEGLRSST